MKLSSSTCAHSQGSSLGTSPWPRWINPELTHRLVAQHRVTKLLQIHENSLPSRNQARQDRLLPFDGNKTRKQTKSSCSYFFLSAGSLYRCGGNSGNSKYSCPQGFKPMLPQVDVRHLYSVVILAEELNFTRAAHRLRITQSALSRQITELETQHGFQLFNRDRKRAAQLTEAGRTFVQEARSALLHADRAIHF